MSRPGLLRRAAIPATGLAALTLLVTQGVAAQAELALEFGGSQFGPPVGVEGEYARYAVGGLRGSLWAPGGSGLVGSVIYGQTLDGAAGGSFLSGTLDGRASARLSSIVTTALDVRLLGYGTRSPFPFRAFAVEGGPSLGLRTDRVGIEVSAVGGAGRSRIELRRVADGPSRLFVNDLWRTGVTGELTLGPLTSNVGLAGGWHRSPVGDYRSLGGRLSFAGGWGIVELRADRWTTPVGEETTAGLSLMIPLGAIWDLRGFFGRTDPDPLTLAQPGSASGGLLVSRTIVGGGANDELPAIHPLYEVRSDEPGERRVRFTLSAPHGSTKVDVTGDFTLWVPVPMARDGQRWTVELEVPEGTHHYGFLVDEQWYVPDDAPDVAPDEWGRETATLVIEGAVR